MLLILGLLMPLAASPAVEGALDPATGTPSADGSVMWFDALALGVEGQGWSGDDLKRPYDRLPAEAEGVVRDAVWGLSQHSAGLCVRFVTDSPVIRARWSVRNEELGMPHMPATGVSGLDLYARRGDGWGWVGAGRPHQKDNEGVLVEGAPEGMHEYLLYLPLYNGTESLHLGVAPDSVLAKAPAYPEERSKPVLFWGTSILQGGCASRPGMAYPSILGRKLNRPTINLGFSGNGQMDPEVTALIAKLDPAAYVIDCLPNMSEDMVTERMEPLVRALREAHPDTPIVFVECVHYQQAWFLVQRWGAPYQKVNAALRAEYDRLVEEGVTGLHYIPGDDLFGHDSEAAVDGVHATDLGFLRMADAIEPYLREILP